MSQWQSGDTLDSVTLNARMASAATSAGFSTNTLRPESGNTIAALAALSTNTLVPSSGTLSIVSGKLFVPVLSAQAISNANAIPELTDTFAAIDIEVLTGSAFYPAFAGSTKVQNGIFLQFQGNSNATQEVTGAIAWAIGRANGKTVSVEGLMVNAWADPTGSVDALTGIFLNELTSADAFTGSVNVSGWQLFISQTRVTAPTNGAIFIDAVTNGTTNNYGILIGNVSGTGAFAIKTGTGTVSFGDLLDVSASTIRLRTSGTPTGLGSGNTGDIKWDANYIYVCTSANSWSRATLNRF